MQWADCIKDMEDYIDHDLSKSELWRANRILVKYQDAFSQVKM